MTLFNYSSTASSTNATVSVAEPLTVEVRATATGRRPSGPLNPVKVILKLGATEISSAENNSGAAATDIIAAAEASVGMVAGQQYKLEVVGVAPSNGVITGISLKGTVGGQTLTDSRLVADKAKRRKAG
jgi:hypothetical protein